MAKKKWTKARAEAYADKVLEAWEIHKAEQAKSDYNFISALCKLRESLEE